MREPGTEEAAIAAEIACIRSLPSKALRRRWQAVFGRKPPAALSKDLLGSRYYRGERTSAAPPVSKVSANSAVLV